MKRNDTSSPTDAGTSTEGTPLATVRKLLAEYDIGVAFGLSLQTGQRVMRLVDGRTGEPSHELPSDVRHRLAGFAARLAGRPAER
jgi:hypothetical protein